MWISAITQRGTFEMKKKWKMEKKKYFLYWCKVNNSQLVPILFIFCTRTMMHCPVDGFMHSTDQQLLAILCQLTKHCAEKWEKEDCQQINNFVLLTLKFSFTRMIHSTQRRCHIKGYKISSKTQVFINMIFNCLTATLCCLKAFVMRSIWLRVWRGHLTFLHSCGRVKKLHLFQEVPWMQCFHGSVTSVVSETSKGLLKYVPVIFD